MTGIYEAYFRKYRHDYYPTLCISRREGNDLKPLTAWHVTNAWAVAGLLSSIRELCPDLRRGGDMMNLRCRERECDHCHGGR